MAVSGKKREDLRQVWAVTLGLCELPGAEQRRAKGQAAFVMLAFKVQHALFSSSVDRPRVPGVIDSLPRFAGPAGGASHTQSQSERAS